MPIKRCTKDGKPGFKWGNEGTCYPYTAGNEQSRKNARDKARKQGQAIELEKKRRGKPSEFVTDEIDGECEECKIEESVHHDECPKGYHKENGKCVKNK